MERRELSPDFESHVRDGDARARAFAAVGARARPGCWMRQRTRHRAGARAPSFRPLCCDRRVDEHAPHGARPFASKPCSSRVVRPRRCGCAAVDRVADAIFSTATFHWALDHPALFSSLFRSLKPGGRLVAQCGGGPNIRRLRDRASALMHEPEFAPYSHGVAASLGICRCRNYQRPPSGSRFQGHRDERRAGARRALRR